MPKRKPTQVDHDVEAGKYDDLIRSLAGGFRLATSTISACKRCDRLIRSNRFDAAKVSATRSLFKLGMQANALIAEPAKKHD